VPRFLVPFLAAAGLAACRAPDPGGLDEAYLATLEARTEVGFNAHGEASQERLARSREVVLEMVSSGRIRSAGEHVQAAFVLTSSRELAELDLAHRLALRAGELGDARGWPIAAEALDRALYLQGQPQRFGTQYVYEPVLQRWALYPVDPTTSDEERSEFGIPPLAALRAWEQELNRKPEAE
jgi:hypothetical protein